MYLSPPSAGMGSQEATETSTLSRHLAGMGQGSWSGTCRSSRGGSLPAPPPGPPLLAPLPLSPVKLPPGPLGRLSVGPCIPHFSFFEGRTGVENSETHLLSRLELLDVPPLSGTFFRS